MTSMLPLLLLTLSVYFQQTEGLPWINLQSSCFVSTTTSIKRSNLVNRLKMVQQNNEVFLGLDVGTQSTKAVLFSPHSQSIVARASSQYDLDEDKEKHPGRAEQHPAKWIQAIHVCFQQLAPVLKKEDYEITGVGVSGQQHGMVALDENLQIVRSAKLWCDVEASSQAEEFSAKATELMRSNKVIEESCTWTIPAGFTAPKVLWMKQNEPELFQKSKYVILPHDYINLCLRTGLGHDMDASKYTQDNVHEFQPDHSFINKDDPMAIPTTDAGDASGTGILHPSEPRYVDEISQIISEDYTSKLPRILSPNESSGVLSSRWKRILGIGTENSAEIMEEKKRKTNPIQISAGSGDNMCSAMGVKCTDPGKAVLSLGTSGTIFGVSQSAVKMGTPVAAFRDATGRYLPLVCVMSCTGVLNSVLENMCTDASSSMTHEEASHQAEKVPPGCHGLTFLPYLGGERTPDWPHSSGALLGLNSQNMKEIGNNNAGIMYRVAMEGITYLMADAMDQIRESCGEGFQPTSLYVVGGGSKNSLWRQMLADVLNVDLMFPTEPESAALGAAFQGGAVVKGLSVEDFVRKQNVEMEDTVVTPTNDDEVLTIYREGLKRYKKLSRKLFE